MKIQQVPSPVHLIPARSAEVSRFLQVLRLGEVLNAEILDQLGDSKVRVRLGDRVLIASYPGPLESGAVFRVQVASPWPNVLLKILPPLSTHESTLQRILWKVLPYLDAEVAKQLWNQAFEELKLLQPQGFLGKEDAASCLLRLCLGPASWNLLTYLKESGLLLESKLAGRAGFEPRGGPAFDLKALILQGLHGNYENASGRQAIWGLLDLIQGAQSLSLISRDGETHLYLPLLLWGFQEGDWGDLMIRGQGGGRGKRGRSWSVHLRLDLKMLGKLLVHMTLNGGLLRCSVRAAKPSTQRQIQEGLPVLQGKLFALGFRAVRCRCSALDDLETWSKASWVIPEGILQMRV
jgi:hypothetical protein